MRILTSPTFDRYAKKLHPNEKETLNKAVSAIRDDPLLGEPKKGDLEGLYIQIQDESTIVVAGLYS